MTADLRHGEKRRCFERLLDLGVATLHLDPRKPGVQVPKKFAGQEMLLLNYSYRYHIQDFRFDDREVVATLTFQGVPFQCVVPWTSVFAVTNPAREGLVWEEDVPAELLQTAADPDAQPEPAPAPPRPKLAPRKKPALASAPEPPAEPPAAPRPGLQVLDGGQGEGPRPGAPRKSGHLRRIK